MTAVKDEPAKDYFTYFDNIIKYNRANQSIVNDLKTLDKTLEDGRENEVLQNALTELLKTCDKSSLMKYTQLKKNEDVLINENKQLRSELENLNDKLILEKKSWEEKHHEEITAVESKWKRELDKLSNDLQFSRQRLEKQEQELYNEIQMVQATSAMQCDELEAKHSQEITALNEKLRDANLSCSKLRTDNHNLKAQYTIQLGNKDKRISELEWKLQATQNLLSERQGPLQCEKGVKQASMMYNVADDLHEVENLGAQEKETSRQEYGNFPGNVDSSMISVTSKNVSNEKNKNNKSDVSSKYRPLEVTKKSPEEDDFLDFTCINKDYLSLPSKKTLPTVYKAGSRNTMRKDEGNKFTLLPPLKQCSDASNKDIRITDTDVKKNFTKKRKLYDPNDLDYLVSLEDN